VVIAIFGILIALLLPAVQSARDAARRGACTNNMRQLGLALHNYHDSNKVFPSASYALLSCSTRARNPGAKNTLNATGWVSVLPFLELGSISMRYDYNQAASTARSNQATANRGAILGDPVASGNGALVATKLALFTCPSDPSDPFQPHNSAFYSIKPGSSLRGARTTYDFSTNCSVLCKYWSSLAVNLRHLFGEDSRTGLHDIRDGASNTIMVCETTLDVINGNGNCWGYRGWVMNGVDPACKQQSGRGINIWFRAGRPESRIPGQLGSWSWPGSNHPGGCHFLFADNSVHFLSESTAFTVLSTLAKYADGTAVPTDFER